MSKYGHGMRDCCDSPTDGMHIRGCANHIGKEKEDAIVAELIRAMAQEGMGVGENPNGGFLVRNNKYEAAMKGQYDLRQRAERAEHALTRLIAHVEAHGLREGPPPVGDTWPGLDWFKGQAS